MSAIATALISWPSGTPATTNSSPRYSVSARDPLDELVQLRIRAPAPLRSQLGREQGLRVCDRVPHIRNAQEHNRVRRYRSSKRLLYRTPGCRIFFERLLEGDQVLHHLQVIAGIAAPRDLLFDGVPLPSTVRR